MITELPVDIPMQVMDHDPDTVWRVGMRLAPGVKGSGWRLRFTSREAADIARRHMLRCAKYVASADDVSETTIWETMDEVRAAAGYGVILRNEAMQEVRRYPV